MATVTSAPSSSSKEISFSLTATGGLPLAASQGSPAARSPSPVESAAQRTAPRTAVLAASQDHHALRDVLGDALGAGDVLTDAAARGLGVTASTAKRTASPGTLPTGTLPVLNRSSGEVIKALTNRTAQRGTGTLAASQDQHALRDVLGDALGLDSQPGRRPSQSTMEGARGTQHSRSTGSVKEETIPSFDEVSIRGDGGIFMDQVSPAVRLKVAMAVRLFSRAFSSVVGEFRRHAKVTGVTIVSDDASAERALKELRRLGDRVHGWDTETTEVQLGRRGQTPCHTGKVVCATAYCGDDVDFGNGPMLLIDNSGPAAGLIQRKFRKYFEDSKYQKVFHNYTFDKLMLKREGIEVKGLAADTLVLARIHDTSLASWEGDIRHKKLKKDLSMARGPNFEREQVSVPSRAVHGVAFAGKKLDMKSFSVSNLHTISIPKEEAGKIKSIPKRRMGYDLKSLAFQYVPSGFYLADCFLSLDAYLGKHLLVPIKGPLSSPDDNDMSDQSPELARPIADGDDAAVSDPSDLDIDSADERGDWADGSDGDETDENDETPSVKEESETSGSDDDEECSTAGPAGDGEGDEGPTDSHVPRPLHRPGGALAPSPKLKAFWQKFVVPKHGGSKDPMSEDDSESGSPDNEPAPPNPPPPTPSATSESDQELDECETPESDDIADGMETMGNGGDVSGEEIEGKAVVSEEFFCGEMAKGSIANHAKAGYFQVFLLLMGMVYQRFKSFNMRFIDHDTPIFSLLNSGHDRFSFLFK
eukprot:symbB.v1.2.017196.t2/scaffold1335.1/size146336/7